MSLTFLSVGALEEQGQISLFLCGGTHNTAFAFILLLLTGMLLLSCCRRSHYFRPGFGGPAVLWLWLGLLNRYDFLFSFSFSFSVSLKVLAGGSVKGEAVAQEAVMGLEDVMSVVWGEDISGGLGAEYSCSLLGLSSEADSISRSLSSSASLSSLNRL